MKMHVEMKELGPVGEGGVRRKFLYIDPSMHIFEIKLIHCTSCRFSL